MDKLARLGWLGVSLPERYGGGGQGLVEELLFLEETERGLLPIHGYSVAMTMAGYYLSSGTEEQKQAVLPKIAQGRYASIALSEPEAGSDLGAARCSARLDGDTYVINGQKTWISEAHLADNLLTLVRTDSTGSKHEGLTLLTVPATADGIEIRPIRTMGAHIVNDVFFTGCRVPADGVVGTEGGAWKLLTEGLNVERLYIAAMSVGLAQRCFDDTLAYVKQREQFGKRIGQFQVIKHRIADLATEIEATRSLVYDVAAKADAGDTTDVNRLASMTKLKASSVAKQTALEGMQLMGGAGYSAAFEMEALVRAALLPPIYGGSNEIQRGIIGKSYGL
jgi:alkylation response protein AidB-like acyl-CoA dehydrogenase